MIIWASFGGGGLPGGSSGSSVSSGSLSSQAERDQRMKDCGVDKTDLQLGRENSYSFLYDIHICI